MHLTSCHCLSWLFILAAVHTAVGTDEGIRIQQLGVEAFDFYGIPHGIAPQQQALANASLTIEGAGFHRVLTYTIQIPQLDDVLGPQGACAEKLLIIQNLPSVLFVDPYELEQQRWAQGMTSFKIFGEVDLESPEVAAEPTVLVIEQGVSGREGWRSAFSIPLHIKYPDTVWRQEDGAWCEQLLAGYSTINLPSPQLLATSNICSQERPQPHQQQDQQPAPQQWLALPMSSQDVTIFAPAGALDHAMVVGWSTLFVTYVCCCVVGVGSVRWGRLPWQ